MHLDSGSSQGFGSVARLSSAEYTVAPQVEQVAKPTQGPPTIFRFDEIRCSGIFGHIESHDPYIWSLEEAVLVLGIFSAHQGSSRGLHSHRGIGPDNPENSFSSGIRLRDIPCNLRDMGTNTRSDVDLSKKICVRDRQRCIVRIKAFGHIAFRILKTVMDIHAAPKNNLRRKSPTDNWKDMSSIHEILCIVLLLARGGGSRDPVAGEKGGGDLDSVTWRISDGVTRSDGL